MTKFTSIKGKYFTHVENEIKLNNLSSFLPISTMDAKN